MTKVLVRFYLDDQRDADLLDWLRQQTNRSATIRQALRANVADDPNLVSTRVGLDPATLRAVLREELARIGVADSLSLTALGSGSEDDDLRAALDDLVSTWDLEPEEQP